MGYQSPLNLKELEAVIKLMKKHHVNGFQDEHFSLQINEFPEKKKRVRKPKKQELTPAEMLAPHLEPLPEEPWMSVSDNELDEFRLTGKVE